ncbi:MAG: cytotoxic translational repressor of toxin-antitoxin stability system [Deltaproteobacteria bacterium]|jgi:hypothetical protein|nr:cytotoxic translational repressor of toxin-antitoxin stability system [Deltaproteobacteria bacterium]
MTNEAPPWTVTFSGQADKQKEKLPTNMREKLFALAHELRWEGPEQPEWPHYGKLSGRKKGEDYRHCHLNKGKPRYVAVWKVLDMELQLMEIRYAGTHENADYRRIS